MWLVFKTTLSAEECLERMRASTGKLAPRFGGGYRATASIIGHVSEDGLSLRRHIDYGNSFALNFYGTIRPTENGAVIRGVFCFHPLVIALMTGWLAFVPLPLKLVAIPLTAFGLFAARHDKAAIRKLIEDCLGDRVPGVSPSRHE